MSPAYKNMQFTFIDKRATDFQRGDVIVFYCATLKCTMVKRIIAIPGDTILISNGSVFINDIQSPYIHDAVVYSGIASNSLPISDDYFFVMGDNHAQSQDSRYKEIGCISREDIIGRIIPNRPPAVQKTAPNDA